MRILTQRTALTTLLAASLGGVAQADEILVSGPITTSETWTADNTYNLQGQIYVEPGASLTIQGGTVIASNTGEGGSLAVARGAQIFVLGDRNNPVIMTSKADVATWKNGNPRNGEWREGSNEWGNLTVMGEGYISEDATPGNTAVPSASNEASMEGLVSEFSGDTRQLYGGGNDDDDSGIIRYLSLRYGGKVVALNNELNALSLGGIGRETDIHHIDIMNNVDDGIEIWGGAANFKYINIWNIGDDSFDVDQGYRGKIQFVNIVQGYSSDDSQGSGVGDNCFEIDGAENSHWQPVTTTVVYNATVVGQPLQGDGGTVWRDNARVQYNNCVFVDLGDRLVQFDNIDGDGAQGYGFMGTLSWLATWATPYTATSTVNPFASPAGKYLAQTSGNLAQITDSVFWRNLAGAAYTEATNVGVFNGANNNTLVAGFNIADAPVRALDRGALVNKGGKDMLPLIGYDPRAQNEAATSVGSAPSDGFYTPVRYRGAFGPKRADNWLLGWTAADGFDFLAPEKPLQQDVPDSLGSQKQRLP